MMVPDQHEVRDLLEAARARVAVSMPLLARERFVFTAKDVGKWLLAVGQAASERSNWGGRKADPDVTTIYAEAADDGDDVYAICIGATVATARGDFEELVGDELGDLDVPLLRLAGMTAAKEYSRTATDSEQQEAVDDMVRLGIFDLFDRGLVEAGDFLLRLAVRRHEDVTICVWERNEAGGWHATVHHLDD